MKTIWGVTVVAATLFMAGGLSLGTLTEYVQVFRNRAQDVIDDTIPLSVEIDRMEVLLAKLDKQVIQQQKIVATSEIALQDAKAQWQQRRNRCQTLISQMRTLRGSVAPVRVSARACGSTTITVSKKDAHTTVTPELERALASYKVQNSACEAQGEVVTRQQEAFDSLHRQFVGWQNDRSLLKQRLETLRVRYQAQQLTSHTNTEIIDDANLARAAELADKIERELRIAEASQRLGLAEAPVSSVTTYSDAAALQAEVDQILGVADGDI